MITSARKWMEDYFPRRQFSTKTITLYFGLVVGTLVLVNTAYSFAALSRGGGGASGTPIMTPPIGRGPVVPVPAPSTCDGCHEPDTLLSDTPYGQTEDEWTCYWPEWPTTRPREGHSLTFLVSHLVSTDSSRSLDHLSTFSTHDVGDEVRTIVGVINEDAGTICIGHKAEECAPRVVLSQERRDTIREQYLGTNLEFKKDFYPIAMQQSADFLGLYRLYQKRCQGNDDPFLFSFLDNDNGACPGFGYHLSSIRHYAEYSYVGRSGHPFGLRISPGSSGFLVRPKFVDGYIDILEWIVHGGGSQWLHAAESVFDQWARGDVVAPGHESRPGVGMFQYYNTILTHLESERSYLLSDEELSTRMVSTCGEGLWWIDNRMKNDECFGQAWRPCTTDKWGEYVTGPPNVYDRFPNWYVDKLIENQASPINAQGFRVKMEPARGGGGGGLWGLIKVLGLVLVGAGAWYLQRKSAGGSSILLGKMS